MEKKSNQNDEVQIVEVRHKTQKKSDRNKMRQMMAVGILVLFFILALVLFFLPKEKKENGEKQSDLTVTEQKESKESATEQNFTWKPEDASSELVSFIDSFYQAYYLSGDVNEMAKYIDSAESLNADRFAIHKKYVEQVSDVVCYQPELDVINGDYTILVIAYKVKLYNYAELLPSLDVLFLANGEDGYKVHNLTVEDEFDEQKIKNDTNFQILSKQVSEELQSLLAANADLNNVYQLYLNPAG